MGVTLAAIPLCSSMTLFFVNTAVNGFVAGGSDTAVNVWMMELWTDKTGPYLQTMHFVFGGGSILAPLIVKPFLCTQSHSQQSMTNFTEITNATNKTNTLAMDERSEQSSQLYIPYGICGGVLIIAAFLLALLYCFKKYEADKVTTDLSEIKNESNRLQLPRSLQIFILLVSGLILTSYLGMSMNYSQFISAFAHLINPDFDKQQAALLVSVLALSSTITRGIGILVAIKIHPQTILYIHFLIVIAANTLIMIYASTSTTVLWVGNILYGIGMLVLLKALQHSADINFFAQDVHRYIHQFIPFFGSTSLLRIP